MRTIDELYRESTPVALRTLRERYAIGKREMARRVGWDVQRYRTYEDSNIDRDGLPGSLYAGVRDVLLQAGASRQEVWALLSPEVRVEFLSLHEEIQLNEQKLNAVRSAMNVDRPTRDHNK